MRTLLLGILLAQGVALPQVSNGVVTGRLLSMDGNPVAGVRVTALAAQDAGAQTPGPAPAQASDAMILSIAQTDTLGTYRLENVPPGRYYIMAGLVDQPSYFPGAGTLAGATVVTVGAGRVMEGVDFRLVRSPGVTVSGRVTGMPFSSSPLITGMRVVMTAQGAPSFDTAIDAGGAFEFRRVPPGSYIARVVALPASATAGTKSVVVSDKDIHGIELAASNVVLGRVVVEGGAGLPVPASVLAVAGSAPDAPTLMTIEARRNNTAIAASTIRADGFFSLSLAEGQYQVRLTALPFGYYYKSINYGSANLLRESLKLNGPAESEIVVTLTATPGNSAPSEFRVSGRVNGIPAGGLPGPLFVTITGTRAEGIRGSSDLPVNSDGTFEFQRIPPGSYTARIAGTAVDPLRSVATIVVKDRDVTDIRLPLVFRFEVSGHADVKDRNGASMAAPSGFSIEFKRADSTTIVSAAIRADGSFRTTLPEGDHVVALKIPAGYVVNAISSGSIDLLTAPLRLVGPSPPPEIVITLEFTGAGTP